MVARLVPLVALALVLTACDGATAPDLNGDEDGTPAGTPGGAGAGAEVTIDDLAFGQQEITVSPGTTVVWINDDSVGHTVTHGEDGQPANDAAFDEPIGVGEEVSHTFDEPGTYQVTCTIHPQMNMTVIVE